MQKRRTSRRWLVVPLLAVLLAALVSATPAQARPFRWNPAHPCTGVGWTTHITAAMLPKVGRCPALQAQPGTYPKVYTRQGPSPAVVRRAAVNGDPELNACLSTVFHIAIQYQGFCKATVHSRWSWKSIEGVKAAQYTNKTAVKVDDEIIQRAHGPHRKGDSTNILKACSAGAIGGFIASITSGPGIIFGVTGGCVGGGLTVVFTDH